MLASSQDGALPLRISELSVRELLESVARRFAARAAEQGRFSRSKPRLKRQSAGTGVRLEQALGNLVDNALRHGSGPVRLDAQPENGELVLRVSDEGEGFPPDFLPHAFERFSRADEARTKGGAGLGLAIVEAVARAHGGSASAATHGAGGALVTIRIPLRQEPRSSR